jgi:hypothetical protein
MSRDSPIAMRPVHCARHFASQRATEEHRGNALVCVWEYLPVNRARSTRFKRAATWCARPLGEVVQTYTSLGRRPGALTLVLSGCREVVC